MFSPKAILIGNLQEYGQAPLSWVAERRHKGVLQLLLEKGANIDANVKSGETMLHRALRVGKKR